MRTVLGAVDFSVRTVLGGVVTGAVDFSVRTVLGVLLLGYLIFRDITDAVAQSDLQ